MYRESDGDINLGRDTTGLGLAGDQTLPSLGALADDVHGVPITLSITGIVHKYCC